MNNNENLLMPLNEADLTLNMGHTQTYAHILLVRKTPPLMDSDQYKSGRPGECVNYLQTEDQSTDLTFSLSTKLIFRWHQTEAALISHCNIANVMSLFQSLVTAERQTTGMKLAVEQRWRSFTTPKTLWQHI